MLCLVAQSCPTLCDPMDCSLPGSSDHGNSPGKNTRVGFHSLLQGIFLTKGLNSDLLCLLQWQVDSLPLSPLGIPYRCPAMLSHSVMPNSLRPHGLQPARLLCPWGFSRQEYWSGLPCPPPWDCPNPGIESRSPALQAGFLPTEPQEQACNWHVNKDVLCCA